MSEEMNMNDMREDVVADSSATPSASIVNSNDYEDAATVANESEEEAVKHAAVDKSHPDYVPTKEKIFYGVGALMDGGGVALMSCVMLNYMTDHLKIFAATASTVMMVSKIWDAITDPIMGHISDNTRSKYGRRKPYMFVGGFMLIVALLLLFAPIKDWGVTSQAGMVAYVLIFYIVWNTCSTITQVPYTSMASDISPNFRERNNANTVKLVFSAAAAGLAYIIPLLLLGNLTKGKMSATVFWILMVAIFGTLFGGGLICTGLFTKERITETGPRKKFNIKEFFMGYARPFRNKSYRWHIIMYVAAFTCMDMLSALAAYYATHVWKGVKLDLGFMEMQFGSMFIVAPLMVAAVLAFPVVRILIDKKGKSFAFGVGLPFYITGGILLAILDPAWCPPIVIPVVSFIMGLGFGGAQMVPWMVFPDTLDVAELATGERPTGNYSGIMTLVRKIGGALGVGMIGWILSGVGYDKYINVFKAYQDMSGDSFSQITSMQIGESIKANAEAISAHLDVLHAVDPSNLTMSPAEVCMAADNVSKVLLTIRLLMGIAIAILISIALFGSVMYNVTSKKLTRMRYFIEKQKAGELDSLTEEEKTERAAMIKELYGKVKEE